MILYDVSIQDFNQVTMCKTRSMFNLFDAVQIRAMFSFTNTRVMSRVITLKSFKCNRVQMNFAQSILQHLIKGLPKLQTLHKHIAVFLPGQRTPTISLCNVIFNNRNSENSGAVYLTLRNGETENLS